MIRFGNRNDENYDEKFLVPAMDTYEDGSATMTIVASVKADEPTLERVEVRARVEHA